MSIKKWRKGGTPYQGELAVRREIDQDILFAVLGISPNRLK